jgi:hypothetical protein
MAVHLSNESAVRRQSWVDRGNDAESDVPTATGRAEAQPGTAAASPAALSRLLAPSPRDPNAQRARWGQEFEGAARDLPPPLHKPGREPVWRGRDPRSLADGPALARLPTPAAPFAPADRRSFIPERAPQATRLSVREPMREPVRASVPEAARIAIAAARAQALVGSAVAGAAGAAAAIAITPQPTPAPSRGSWFKHLGHSLQARTERAHHQAELRHAALAASTALQGGSGWLRGLSQFSGRLHALAASLRTPVPALQAAARDAAALDGVTAAVHQRFAAQAGDKQAFTALLRQAFGDKFDAGKAETIRQQALAGDFSWAPKVEVASSQALADLSGTQGAGTAQGAYVKSSDTIYISRELLHADPAQAQRLLMEEMGHGLDARINTSDAVGDEGEIFSKLMHGDAISAPEMAALKADNDHGVVMINGQAVTVEYGFFSKIGKAITGGIKKVAGAVTKGVVNLAKSAVTVGTGLVTMDFDKVKDGLKDGVNAVKDSVKAVHKAVVDSAKEIHRITKQAFQKLMQSKLFAAVLMVCRFIPIPIVQLVVHIVDAVRAGYMVYQGIKHKSLGMVLGGVASLVSGAGNVAGALGASTATVGTISSVASAASKLSMAYNAVANKDIGAAMGLLGGVSGVQGTALGTAAGYVQQGLGIRQAVRSGDAAAALSGTFGLAQSVSQQLGAGVAQQQQQREAEAADNRGLLNAADRDLRAMPAEQAGAVAGGTPVAPALDNRSLLNASERESNPGAYASVAGSARVARAGDSISRLVGTSDPQAIGNFMRANNLTSDRIAAGRNYFVPDSSTAYGHSVELGQVTLDTGNERIAARAQDIQRIRAFVNRDDPVLRAQIEADFAAGRSIVRQNSLAGWRAESDARGEWKNAFEEPASMTNHLAVGGQLSLLGAAKYDSLTILQRAAPLHSSSQLSIGAAESLDDASKLFRSPTGQAATSLAEASAKYGGALRGLGYVGAAATVVEETAFVMRSPEGTRLNAYGSSAVNVAGDGAATYAGFKAGAALGTLGGPIAPVTIPLVGAIGGFIGHWVYDSYVKPDVREAFTGVREPN